MHMLLAEKILENCKQREREGDCTTTRAFSVEMLEDAVMEIARQRDKAANEALSILGTAMQKFAPDLSAELSARWKRANAERDAALERFLVVLRDPATKDAAP